MPDSPFLRLPPSEWVASNALAFAIRDAFPVTTGHTLVVPKRPVATWFDATPEEQQALMALVDVVRRDLQGSLQPDGFNVGFNAGAAAGQTVFHLHVHVIPRWHGDVEDPRGGVRHVIPGKGNYLRETRDVSAPLATGGRADPFSRHLLPLLESAREVAIVAAFVQDRGLDRIESAVQGALARGARVRFLTGDYLNITQVRALERLLDWQSTWGGNAEDGAPSGTVEARVIEVGSGPGQPRSFHPKSWRVEADGYGVAWVGSSNLSWQALEDGVLDRELTAAITMAVAGASPPLGPGRRDRAGDAGRAGGAPDRVRLRGPLRCGCSDTRTGTSPTPRPAASSGPRAWGSSTTYLLNVDQLPADGPRRARPGLARADAARHEAIHRLLNDVKIYPASAPSGLGISPYELADHFWSRLEPAAALIEGGKMTLYGWDSSTSAFVRRAP